MGLTKHKLRTNDCALGGWIMINHPAVAELMAGEGFDWIAVDMEHAAFDLAGLENIERAVHARGADLLVRLDAVNPLLARHVIDSGADGIIIPTVMTPEDVDLMVAAVKYPPVGKRGTSLVKALDYGRNFESYIKSHNDNVIVAVMIEHIEAARNARAILSRPGIDACFIGPYDLSASMGIPGQITHPDLLAAEELILEACREHGIAPGYHVVPVSAEMIQQRIAKGYRFLACSIDTQIIMDGCRRMLAGVQDSSATALLKE